MLFFYNGKTPSKGYDIASGCLLIIAFSAIIFLFTMLDSIEDLKEYAFQLILALIIGVGFIFQLFRKKGKLHTNKIEIKNDFLFINNLKILTDNITLDIYTFNNSFSRYHFWDSKGMFSVYSVIEDDLINSFASKYPENTNTHEEVSSEKDGASVSISCISTHLSYDLESGEFTKQKDGKIAFNTIPEFFIYDPKYKKGKTLLNKK